MARSHTVKFRLMRDAAEPPTPDGSPRRFGLQDNRGRLHGEIQRRAGNWAFEIYLLP